MNGETVEKDFGYKRLLGDLRHLKNSYVDTGIFGGRNLKKGKGSSIVDYAFANEFGATIEMNTGRNFTTFVRITERSFMRSTVDENRRKYEMAIDVGFNRIGLGQTTPRAVLTIIGMTVRTDIQRKIRSGPFEPNAPSTVARKGSSKPLIDTGTMRRAVEYKLSTGVA